MSIRSRLVVATLWLLSLVFVGTLAAGQHLGFNPLEEPIVVSGDDIGFRVEGYVGDFPGGPLVIRLNGEWVEPKSPGPAAVPVHSR